MTPQSSYTPPFENGPVVSWFMIGVSGLVHLALVAGLVAMNFTFTPAPPPKFAISVSTVPLQSRDLPPLRGSREAGAPGPRADRTALPKPEPKKEEAKKEEPKPKPKPLETKKPEPKKEEAKPAEKKTPPQEDPKTPADTEVISTKGNKEPEPEPEPRQPTPQEVAKSLESRRDVYRSTNTTEDGAVSRFIASDSDPGGGGGPDLYRSVLVGIIGGLWESPPVRRGEVRDATVEFTIYSPPLARNAVNQVRVARVTNIRIIISSGDLDYDASALEAVRRVRQWPPLPDSYRKETLVVTCRFYLLGEE